MLSVDVQLACSEKDLPDRGALTDWANAAWRHDDDGADVVIRITDEAESRALNHTYRGHDASTNVLSFPFEIPPGVEDGHVGDLLICAPVVAREAVEQGKPLLAHWAHMVVHGLLHLQGFDHENEGAAQTMEGLEREILAGLGFPDPYRVDDLSGMSR